VIFGVIALGIIVTAASGQTQKTTRDKLYSKEQAARGEALYLKHCERCHNPAKVPEGKKPGPPTIGAKFLETWADRTLGELFSTIYTTMPSDGTVTLTVDESLDAVAYLLKANGFPEGTAPLKNDDTMKNAVIVK
jgi:mono/diheme cytochrome c family protein